MRNFCALELIDYIFSMEDEGKTCKECGEYQTLDNFYQRIRHGKKMEYDAYCLSCRREKNRIRKANQGIRTPPERFWFIPNKPGKFKTIEDKENVEIFLKSVNWIWDDEFKVWLKPGLKEIKDGKIVWPNINEEKVHEKTLISKEEKKFVKETMDIINRPKYDVLKKQVAEHGYRGTARLYDTTYFKVKKWVAFYKKFYDEEKN
jgi:hypothetical protein